MAVEIDVRIGDLVGQHRFRIGCGHLARLFGRRRALHDRVVMTLGHRPQVDGRPLRQVEHTPLRHHAAETHARLVGQFEITRREHPAVVADPRRNLVLHVLLGTVIELEGDARKHPREVVLVQGVHPEPLGMGVDTRDVEDVSAQRHEGDAQREIDLLRFHPKRICSFSCHGFYCFYILQSFRIARTARRQKHDIPVAAHPHETKKHYICGYFHTNLIQ